MPTIRRVASAVGPPAAILAVQLVFFGMPLGLWMRGVVLGMLTALLAVGLALVYRANRVINFAQADLGGGPVAFSVGLIVFWGWSYWVGLIGGLLFAVLLGVVAEFAIIRRFRRASRLVLTVATIGLANLLVVLSILTPRLWGRNASSERIAAPFDWTFEVGEVILSANDLIAAIVAPLAMAGVAYFLGATRTGLAVRAAAERGDRAAMLGVPVARLSTIVWALAAALSFLALFLQSTVLGVPLVSALRITGLVQALAALVIGRMERLPTIAMTAVAFGVLEYGVRWNTDDPALVEPIVAAAVLIALMLQRRQTSRRDTDTTSTWRGVEEVRPLTPRASRLLGVRLMKVVLPALALVGLWLVPTMLRVDQVIKATAIVVFAVIGLSLVVLTGWAGQISLGQMAIVAVGAAVSSTFTSRWDLDLSLALVVGGAAGAVTAFLIGLPALRLRGLYLAVTTIAFAVAVQSWLLNERLFHWFPPRVQRLDRPPLFGRIDIDDATAYYWYTVVVALVVFAAVIGIRRSRTGRAIIAVRDNERAAQSFSIGAVRAKLTAFTISGVIAGIGGALFVHLNQAFSLDSYAGGQNVAVFASSVVGGLGSVGGAVLGAAYLRGMQWFITSNEWYFLSTAAGVLLVLLLLPGGLVSLCVRARDAYVGWLLRRSDGVPSASTTAAGTKAAAQPADAVTGPTADDVATVEASR
jgi:branched-chain amino acid transport system permease protein